MTQQISIIVSVLSKKETETDVCLYCLKVRLLVVCKMHEPVWKYHLDQGWRRILTMKWARIKDYLGLYVSDSLDWNHLNRLLLLQLPAHQGHKKQLKFLADQKLCLLKDSILLLLVMPYLVQVFPVLLVLQTPTQKEYWLCHQPVSEDRYLRSLDYSCRLPNIH